MHISTVLQLIRPGLLALAALAIEQRPGDLMVISENNTCSAYVLHRNNGSSK
jgi:hypothetical protein